MRRYCPGDRRSVRGSSPRHKRLRREHPRVSIVGTSRESVPSMNRRRGNPTAMTPRFVCREYKVFRNKFGDRRKYGSMKLLKLSYPRYPAYQLRIAFYPPLIAVMKCTSPVGDTGSSKPCGVISPSTAIEIFGRNRPSSSSLAAKPGYFASIFAMIWRTVAPGISNSAQPSVTCLKSAGM